MTTKHVWEHKSGEWIVEVLTKHFAQMHLSDPFQTWWRMHGSRSEETGQNTRGRILRRRAARDIDYAAAAAARLLLLIDGITRRSDQQKGAEIRCNLCTGGNCSTLCRRTTLGRIFLLSQHLGSLSSLLFVFALIASCCSTRSVFGNQRRSICRILSWKGKKDSNSSQIEDKFNSIPVFVFCSDAQTEIHFKCFLQWCSDWDSWVFYSDDADNLGFWWVLGLLQNFVQNLAWNGCQAWAFDSVFWLGKVFQILALWKHWSVVGFLISTIVAVRTSNPYKEKQGFWLVLFYPSFCPSINSDRAN